MWVRVQILGAEDFSVLALSPKSWKTAHTDKKLRRLAGDEVCLKATGSVTLVPPSN
jgi:hypothetical protein